MSRYRKMIQQPMKVLGVFALAEILGVLVAVAVSILIITAMTTESDVIFHLITFTIVLIPAMVSLYFGFKGGRTNLSIWRVGFLLFGIILAPFYILVSGYRLGWI